MKRTQELWRAPFQNYENTRNMSGMREFVGEDLEKGAREKYLKRKQKEWLDEQIREKENKKLKEQEETDLYHKQTMEINKIRGVLESEVHLRKKKRFDDIKRQNKGHSESLTKAMQEERQSELGRQKQDLEMLLERGKEREYSLRFS